MKHLKTYKKKSGENLVDSLPEVQHKAHDKASTCPVDGKQSMKQIVINSVHVDICMKHRGVWLDGGELDLIIQNQKGKVSGTDEKSIEAALEVTDWTGGFEWFGDVLVDSVHIGAEVAVEAGKTVIEVIANAADFIDF